MDKTKCEAFIAAAEGGSLTYAANQLGYTQPGITRMINSLESELGFPLLVRTKHGVSLTSNGEQMLPLLRDIVRVQRAAEEAGSNITGLLSGVLTIGCYYSVSAMLLPNILRTFLKDYPGIHVILKEGTNAELSQMLDDRSVDLCYAAKPASGTICDWIPVMDDELTVWLPEKHPDAGLAKFPVEKLADYPFIITQPEKDTDIDRLLSDTGTHADIHFATRDAYATYRMVEAGLGISLNQRLIAREWNGHVVALPFDPPQYVHLGIVVPSLSEASPAARKFIEYVKASTSF
ncbi:MAG: LysR family transcriptional regulator [Eubacterium sp.]